MGFMPFWQPSTLCFVAVSFHSCIVVSWKINLLSLLAEFTSVGHLKSSGADEL